MPNIISCHVKYYVIPSKLIFKSERFWPSSCYIWAIGCPWLIEQPNLHWESNYGRWSLTTTNVIGKLKTIGCPSTSIYIAPLPTSRVKMIAAAFNVFFNYFGII